PGLARSAALVAGLTAAITVAARSAAEMPVPAPFRSIGTQNAVPNVVVLELTASGISSSSRRAPVIERQIRPRPYFAMKLITAGVTFSAAIVKSPSFSRSSSSQTMIIWPSRTAATASSIEANGVRLRAPFAMRMFFVIFSPSRSTVTTRLTSALPTRESGRHRTPTRLGRLQPACVLRQFQRSRDVLADHVALDVDAIPYLQRRECRVRPGERDYHHVEYVFTESRNRQADPVDGN